MPETLDLTAYDDLQKVVDWTKAWYAEAVASNFISHPYRAEQEVVTRLHQYYRAGLTPAEATEACFGVKH